MQEYSNRTEIGSPNRVPAYTPAVTPSVPAPRPPAAGWVAAAALISGSLLALAGPPLFQPALLLVALVPLLVVLMHPGTGLARGALAALATAFVHNLLRAMVLQFPLGFALLLGVSLSVLWLPLGLVVPALGRRLPRTALLAVTPAAVVAVEYLGVSLVPVFGTAESFGRALAPWPFALASAAWVGFAGPVALLTLAQAGIAHAWIGRRRTEAIALGATTLILAAGVTVIAGAIRLAEAPTSTVRVAAVGWTYEDEGSPWDWRGRWPIQFETLLAPLVRDAATDGAALVVAPEAAFALGAGDTEPFMDAVAALAEETGAALVVGYFDDARGVNEAVLMAADGHPLGPYRKTHLIPFMEDYTAGVGERIVGDSAVGRLGLLICQDDNFPDLARGYSRDGAVALAVPTNDWELVEAFHLQNTALRAVDSNLAVIRGATNGVSAVIDARGRVLASRAHNREGRGVAIADLPLYSPGSLHGRIGNLLPIACLAGLILAGAAGVARQRR
jgi:apolipoprotein N-acyltransferase